MKIFSPAFDKPNPKVSTLAVFSCPGSEAEETTPPSATTPPLTAQHAWCRRTRVRLGKGSHCSLPRSSHHTSLVFTPPPRCPPHTKSLGRVRNHHLAPSCAALHTPVSRHAPTSPQYAAMRAHSSGRRRAFVAPEPARARDRVAGAIVVRRGGRECPGVCNKWGWRRDGGKKGKSPKEKLLFIRCPQKEVRPLVFKSVEKERTTRGESLEFSPYDTRQKEPGYCKLQSDSQTVHCSALLLCYFSTPATQPYQAHTQNPKPKTQNPKP